MTGYVVDASVAVKWLVDEVYSDEAAQLLDADLILIAPELLFAEAANALWALCRRGDLSPADYAEACDVLISAPISVPRSLHQLAASAARLALDLDHPVYDCFYLALGVQEQYAVVTADRRFYAKVRAHPYLSDRVLYLSEFG
jgi:predicted nucleic acid-binding protein